jgi:hypothetical protein
MIYVTDLPPDKRLQISDGSKWYSVSDGLEVKDYSPPVVLTYQSSGDTNGLIYYLGATLPGAAFACPVPQTVGQLILNGPYLTTQVSTNFTTGTNSFLAIDRVAGTGGWQPNNVPGSWFMLDLLNRVMCPNKFIWRQKSDSSGNAVRNFVLEGSNNAAAWNTMYQLTNGPSMAANAWATADFPEPSIAYRYLRIRQTGLDNSSANQHHIAEMEFYGTLYAI